MKELRNLSDRTIKDTNLTYLKNEKKIECPRIYKEYRILIAI